MKTWTIEELKTLRVGDLLANRLPDGKLYNYHFVETVKEDGLRIELIYPPRYFRLHNKTGFNKNAGHGLFMNWYELRNSYNKGDLQKAGSLPAFVGIQTLTVVGDWTDSGKVTTPA